jgi:hypothetical protein
VVLVADHPGDEPFFEEVTLASVALVEALGVQAVEPVHGR